MNIALLRRQAPTFLIVVVSTLTFIAFLARAFAGDDEGPPKTQAYAQTDAVVVLSETTADLAGILVAAIRDAPVVADATFDARAETDVALTGNLAAPVAVEAVREGPQQWREVTSGRLPTGADEIAVTAGGDVAVGESTTLYSADGVGTPVTVVGELADSARTEIFAAPDALAQWFSEQLAGEVRIQAAPGTTNEQVAGALGFLSADAALPIESVSTVEDRLLHHTPEHDPAQTWWVAGALALTAVVLAAAQSRVLGRARPELDVLHSLGASSRRVRLRLIAESAAVTLAGVAAGGLLAWPWITDIGIFLLVVVAALIVVPAVTWARTRRVFTVPDTAGGISLGDLLSVAFGVLAASVGLQLADISLPGIGAALNLLAVALLAGPAIVILFRVIDPVLRWTGPVAHQALAAAGSSGPQVRSLIAVVILSSALVTGLIAERTERESGYDVAVSAVGESLAPGTVRALGDADAVAEIVAPPTVDIAGAVGSADTALGLGAAEARTLSAAAVDQLGAAEPGEVVLGAQSPLRGVLVDGSVTDINVAGQLVEVQVVFGDAAQTTIDPALIADDSEEAALVTRVFANVNAPARPSARSLADAIATESTQPLSLDTTSLPDGVMAGDWLMLGGIALLALLGIRVQPRGSDHRVRHALGLTPTQVRGVHFGRGAAHLLPAAAIGVGLGLVLGAG